MFEVATVVLFAEDVVFTTLGVTGVAFSDVFSALDDAVIVNDGSTTFGVNNGAFGFNFMLSLDLGFVLTSDISAASAASCAWYGCSK